MEPPLSPSKFASPSTQNYPASPERTTGRPPLYNVPVFSPSHTMGASRSPSPLRNTHRRTDSDVSVQGLAVMFETLDVKDHREVSKRFRDALDKEKARNAEKLSKLEEKHEMALSRRDVRIEELKSQVEHVSSSLETGVSKSQYEKEWRNHKENVAKWQDTFRQNEEKWKAAYARADHFENSSKTFEQKYIKCKRLMMEANKENLRVTGNIPTLQAKIQSLQRVLNRVEGDVRVKTEEAAKYKDLVYSLEVEVESITARLGEQVDTLRDALRTVEGERDALKTSLKEEEIMRIAAEGNIALPIIGTDEVDEFRSPVRSPRKLRNIQRDEDDKENVSPRKGAADLRFMQQELSTEKRLLERAQEQIEFMKMECQFQCCSCRIAESQGSQYVHDDAYDIEMERIKLSFPVMTPPPSNRGESPMEVIAIKQELVKEQRPFTPPAEVFLQPQHADASNNETNNDVSVLEPDMVVAYSPSTGTFRSMPSPAKVTMPASEVVPVKPVRLPTLESPWTPAAHNTILPAGPVFPQMLLVEPQAEVVRGDRKESTIDVHEDAIADSDDEDDSGPPTPSHEPLGPATPYLMRTITTTTTIPLHFSPATPAFKVGRGPMTPSTVAHAAADARTPVLGELSLNQLPFDREAALQAIRDRRGRARSMAEGHGTPMKQMVEGVKERRDISAPVSRVRR